MIASAAPQKTDADSGSYNSQNFPLPTPAVNPDPASKPQGQLALVDGSALLPDQGPSGAEADIEEYPASSQISVYTVHKGDSLGSIAKMFNVSVNTIVWANDIRGGAIHEGDQLIILPITGIRHTIAKGETLASLAKTYKSNAHEIANFNDLADSTILTPGNVIIIPNGEIAPTAAQVASSAHSKLIKSIASGKHTEPYLGGSGPAINGYFAWPVNGGVITQGLHGWNGVDIGAPKGTAVYASADGTVLVARGGGAWNGGYGNYVVISHSNGTQTLYGHLSKVLVSSGDVVSQGDFIGKVGNTGASTGPHLHFEVRGAKNPFAD